MGSTLHQTENDSWRILLFAQKGSELLVLRRPAGLALPSLQIPRNERIVPRLVAEAQRQWSLDTVCIAPFHIAARHNGTGTANYYVLELRKNETLSTVAPRSMEICAVDERCFADLRDYAAVRRAMRLDGPAPEENSRGPFSEFESFERIFSWVRDEAALTGRRCDGTFRQWQAGDSFALIRFRTDREAVWFKATGEPNQNEFPIIAGLSAMFPSHLPELLAARPEWNAWLSLEVPGNDLFSASGISAWPTAARALAKLQVQSIGATSRILELGAHDARIPRLFPLAGPFFSTIADLMNNQTNPIPARLSPNELNDVAAQMRTALAELESFSIPETLNHFDPNPGNVIVGEDGCRFIDWSEAAVGNPFLTIEFLRQHLSEAFPADSSVHAEVRRYFSDAWKPLLSETVLKRTFQLMPFVAPFAFAVTVLPWNEPIARMKPTTAALLRSLARRMRKELDSLNGHVALRTL